MSIVSEIASIRSGLRRTLSSLGVAAPHDRRSRRPNSADHIRQILEQWNEAVAQHRNVECTGQEFIEPYVLRKRILNYELDLLIGTVSARIWYDQFSTLTDLDYPTQLNMIKPGDVVFDVGAHNGVYSAFYSRLVGPKGRVYAFEPFPTNVLAARFNSLLNDAHVKVFEVAIGDHVGEAVLSANCERPVQSEAETTLTVALDTLDNYAHLRPDFVKIDIEGAEIDALAGAQKLLAGRPNICLEVHTHFFGQYNHRVEDLFDVLPIDDYVCYIDHLGHRMRPYRREFPITEQCHLFLLREDPSERIYPVRPDAKSAA